MTVLRELRNRVFHHERILHWKDLDVRHAAMLETIGWISPELEELTLKLDRFTATRNAGTQPWMDKLTRHWPKALAEPWSPSPRVEILEQPLEATYGADTPFGHRGGGEVLQLQDAHLEALRTGLTVALDVRGEYITYLKHQPTEDRQSS